MFDIISAIPSTLGVETPVIYECTFFNKWTPFDHPSDYPTNAHWSRPVIAAHNSDYIMWQEGIFASPGVKNVAELGSTTTIQAELNAQGQSGTVNDFEIGDNMFLDQQTSQVIGGIDMNENYQQLSSITMIAPSPDWFSGIDGFSMVDETTNLWYESVVLDTYPYDAGTDTGETYEDEDGVRLPPVPVFELTATTVPASGVFLDNSGTNVLPVATWTCELVEAAIATSAPSVAPSIPTTSVPSLSPSNAPSATPVALEPSPMPLPMRKQPAPTPFRCQGRGRGSPGQGGEAGRQSRNNDCL